MASVEETLCADFCRVPEWLLGLGLSLLDNLARYEKSRVR